MTETREKWCHEMVSRTNGKKEHLDKNDFRHGYGDYFKSAILKVT